MEVLLDERCRRRGNDRSMTNGVPPRRIMLQARAGGKNEGRCCRTQRRVSDREFFLDEPCRRRRRGPGMEFPLNQRCRKRGRVSGMECLLDHPCRRRRNDLLMSNGDRTSHAVCIGAQAR